MTPPQFLRRYWQKRPLFVPAAMPDIRDMFSAAGLHALARRDDVESRLVTRVRGHWRVANGPFALRSLQRPAEKHWALLVQGVDLHEHNARALLERFNFIPYARLDDVMLSLAPPGGGVGPHFDSYDVFLLQVHGRRRWRIGAQRDLHLVDEAPLRILRDFRPQHELEASPGDLLYLPPNQAHEGIALTDCITCSIGFRAPARHELAAAFMQWLPERLGLQGRYRDPHLQPQGHPANLDGAMVDQVVRMLASIKWRRKDVATFLGEYLTEPKPQVWFEAPQEILSRPAFMAQARAHGIRLSLKTRLLYRQEQAFINGESVVIPASARPLLRELADRREVVPWPSRGRWQSNLVYEWYRYGYVELGSR
jgi:50S ribosomal protein L16 3-hydroxylase